MRTSPSLASGPEGPDALRPLLDTVLDALSEGTRARGGPLPRGGPKAVAARLRDAVGDVLPADGDPNALHTVVHALAETAADPAAPLCTAHLHCPPLALATAADLAASALNPSLDSWDQAPGASELEALVTGALAREVFGSGGAEDASAPPPATPTTRLTATPTALITTRLTATPTALITTGGTESNQLALLLAREAHGAGLRLVHGANAHHSVPRAAWLVGLAEPVVVPAPAGVLDVAALDEALTELPGPHLVAATAGTTDAGLIDPLPEIAELCAAHGARLHVDAAYGGGLLFSDRYRARLAGLDAADTVTLDLHKLGWQPVAAGLLAVRDPGDLAVLHHRADYLNADDDTEAGLPDLLGRSLRTSRRPDVVKIAVTLKALGRSGLGGLVEQVCDRARDFADLVHGHPGFELYDPPTISTVLFRPAHADDDAVAAVRRMLLTDGRAVLGRARTDGRLWLKTTLLNPHTRPDDLAALLNLVEGNTPG
ncbi:pyridoxal phosphate-dependent decarboxylase family protein [Streptomyces caeruleatus]|uniref:Amino acid decarboxylase n=1 Tax=Streptomyces caeruleatus TaxID=661399 RepID=A0A101U4K6_9ACTN|nr:aminotransferase class V-fold PLP-dependent enzyme [Streptomyces caeruleatus]KUO04051.1 amino acid decarboxylase [Streptomyces caeruleatus]